MNWGSNNMKAGFRDMFTSVREVFGSPKQAWRDGEVKGFSVLGLISVIVLGFAFLTVFSGGASAKLDDTLKYSGEMNSWGADDMTWDDGLGSEFWHVTIQAPSDNSISEYKFQNWDWGNEWGDGGGGGAKVDVNKVADLFWSNSNSASEAQITDGVINGNYYTFRMLDSGYSDTVGTVLETSQSPVSIDSVSDDAGPDVAVVPGQAVTVTVGLSGSKCSEENVYVRYSTDGWSSDSFVQATGSDTNPTATIPGQDGEGSVSYYALTTTATESVLNSDPDLMTLSYNNNSTNNYSYDVSNPANVWHIPSNVEPGLVTMRHTSPDTNEHVYVSTDNMWIYNGEYNETTDQSGGKLYYRVNEGSWDNEDINWDTNNLGTNGNNDYWKANVDPSSWSNGDNIDYYLKTTHTNNPTTYIYENEIAGNSETTGYESVAESNPYSFEVKVMNPVMWSSDSAGSEVDEFVIGDNVYVTGENFITNTNYTIYVLNDNTWSEDENIVGDNVIPTLTFTTDNIGSFSGELAWDNAERGYYDIIVDNGDGKYQSSADGLDDADVDGAGIFVVPEPASIIALLASLGAMMVLLATRRG